MLTVDEAWARCPNLAYSFPTAVKQKDYIFWKHQEMLRLCSRTRLPSESVRRGVHKEWTFWTNYLEQLNFYHRLFYRLEGIHYKKVLPDDLGAHLSNALSLLVWYLDDGTLRKGGNSCRIATQSFSLREQEILRNVLWDNFGVGCKIEGWRRRAGGTQWGVCLLAADWTRFRQLLMELCREECPSMLYKFVRAPL